MRKRSALLLVLVFMLFCLPITAYAEAENASVKPAAENPEIKKPESWNEIEQVPADKADVNNPQDTEDLDTKPDNQDETDIGDALPFDADAVLITDDPPEILDPNMVFNWDQLKVWLDEHEDTGGTVTLGADIEVTDYGYITTWADNLTVNTGVYGFVVSGSLIISECVNITGHGAQSPIIRVLEGGWLYFNGGAYETAATIAVTGEGGCGIVLESGADFSIALGSYVKLSVSGAGSTALESDVALDLRCLFIEAAGDGAQGIVSTQPVKLYLSHIMTEGLAVTAPETTLDTCVVSPDVPGARTMSRRAVALRPTMPIFLELGEVVPGQFADFSPLRCFVTLRAEGAEDESETVWVEFDDSALPYDIAGRHFLPGSLPSPYDLFDLITAEDPLGITVTIFNPLVPCYEDFYIGSGVCIISYIFMGEIADLTLWRSDDEGASWYVYWRDETPAREDFSLKYNGYHLSLQFYCPQEFVTPVLLAIEAGENAGSCVLRVQIDDDETGTGVGGDRDGGDRVTMLSWEAFVRHTGSESPDTYPSESNSNDNPGIGYNGGSVSISSRGDDNGDGGIDLFPEAVPKGSAEPATAELEVFDGTNLVLEPSSPFILPETMAQGFVQDTEPDSKTTVFHNQDDSPIEQGSDPDAGHPPSLDPPIAVTAGVLGAGGAGGLAFFFRRKWVARCK